MIIALSQVIQEDAKSVNAIGMFQGGEMEKVSETISTFLKLIDDCKQKYDWAFENVGIEDKRTQDLLHAIEFEEDPYRMSQLADRLHECRKDRRDYKDIVSLTYIINYWSERNQNSINYLKETLGRIRDEEARQNDRTYVPRVEDELWEDLKA